MRIAGDFSNFQANQIQNNVQVSMLKKSMDQYKQTSSDLLSSMMEATQGIQESSPVGKNVDFYA